MHDKQYSSEATPEQEKFMQEMMVSPEERSLILQRRKRKQAIDEGYPVDSQDEIEDYWSEVSERESDARGWRDVPIRNEAGEIIDTGGWGI